MPPKTLPHPLEHGNMREAKTAIGEGIADLQTILNRAYPYFYVNLIEKTSNPSGQVTYAEYVFDPAISSGFTYPDSILIRGCLDLFIVALNKSVPGLVAVPKISSKTPYISSGSAAGEYFTRSNQPRGGCSSIRQHCLHSGTGITGRTRNQITGAIPSSYVNGRDSRRKFFMGGYRSFWKITKKSFEPSGGGTGSGSHSYFTKLSGISGLMGNRGKKPHSFQESAG